MLKKLILVFILIFFYCDVLQAATYSISHPVITKTLVQRYNYDCVPRYSFTDYIDLAANTLQRPNPSGTSSCGSNDTYYIVSIKGDNGVDLSVTVKYYTSIFSNGTCSAGLTFNTSTGICDPPPPGPPPPCNAPKIHMTNPEGCYDACVSPQIWDTTNRICKEVVSPCLAKKNQTYISGTIFLGEAVCVPANSVTSCLAKEYLTITPNGDPNVASYSYMFNGADCTTGAYTPSQSASLASPTPLVASSTDPVSPTLSETPPSDIPSQTQALTDGLAAVAATISASSNALGADLTAGFNQENAALVNGFNNIVDNNNRALNNVGSTVSSGFSDLESTLKKPVTLNTAPGGTYQPPSGGSGQYVARYNTAVTALKATPLGALLNFGSLPAGTSSMSVSFGSFGDGSVDFADWAGIFAVLKAAMLVGFSWLSIRIIFLKG